MRIIISILAFVLVGGAVSAVSAQSLGEAARKEKKRREENRRSGVPVRVVTEDEIRSEPEVMTRPGVSATSVLEDLPTPDDPASGSEMEGRPAPDFSLSDRTGRNFSLRDFRGRPVLIDFWATWCGPCKQSMPEIEKLHRQYRGRLQVVGINIEGLSDDVIDYLDAGAYTFPVLFDSGNWGAPTLNRFGVDSIPRTFLLDGDGRIVFEGHPQRLSEERIQAAIARR